MKASIKKLWKDIKIAEKISIDSGISVIFNTLDDAMISGKFEFCDEALLFDPAKHPPEYTLAFLSMTIYVKDLLKNRKKLYELTEKHFKTLYSKSQTAKILSGLK